MTTPTLLASLEALLGPQGLLRNSAVSERAVSDEVVVMQHGQVLDSGPPQRIFTPPHQPYTNLLLSSEPQMDPDWLDRQLQIRAPSAKHEEPAR